MSRGAMLRLTEAEYDARRRSPSGHVEVPIVVERPANAAATLASKARTGWPVFEAMLRAAKLPAPQYEFRFNAERRWRFDIAFPRERVAIEVDGGVWSDGRHTRSVGFMADMEKLNAATVAGWQVLRYPPERLCAAIDDLKALLANREMAI